MPCKSSWFLWYDDIKMKNLSPLDISGLSRGERALITRPLESTMTLGDYWAVLQRDFSKQVLQYLSAEGGNGWKKLLAGMDRRKARRHTVYAIWN